MNEKVLHTGYYPRFHQEILHSELRRFNVVVCHRRFGKTIFAINETIDQALRNKKRNPQYAYVAPTYGQAKRVAWEIVKDATKNIPGVTVNEAELRVDIPRNSGDFIRIILLGAENPGSLRGIYLDGVILDEYAECAPSVWTQVIRPALSDRMGWAIFIGTPKGSNHFYDVLGVAKKDPTGTWYYRVFKASETKIIPQSELDAAKQTMSEEEYEQEFECSFTAALVGAYYGKHMERAEKEGRIRSVPHDSALAVDTFWDLGVGDTTCIWFMQEYSRGEWHAIDYYEMAGMGLDHYAKFLKEKPYNYGEHYLPHDGAARSLETGRSRQETLEALGIRPINIVPKQKVEDGISAVRMVLSKVWFDKDKCAHGIDALKNYEQVWDEKNKIFIDKPKHNWASNGADAFRTFAMGRTESRQRISRAELPEADNKFNLFGGR